MFGTKVPEITPEQLKEKMGQYKLLDVRRPDEFKAELGHIPGAVLVTQGPELSNFLSSANKEDRIAFICRSGARSENATKESIKLGFKNTVNMVGGMIRWNELKFPIEK